MSDDVLALLDQSLEKLKDFQLETVHRVMSNFADDSHSGRVLVADEVGLGKTVVAKGVIAEMLKDKLNQDVFKPLSVTYICSNLTLANENKRKLAVFEGREHHQYVSEPSFSRLTELAVRNKQSNGNGENLLEVCSLTPSTSFTLTQGDGWHRERFIIFKLLCGHEALVEYQQQLSKLFQGHCSDATWGNNEFWFSHSKELDKCVLKSFHQLLNTESKYIEESWFGDQDSSWLSIIERICAGEIECSYPNRLRSHLRRLLARCCVKNLKSDLFILDEFQRFNSLLDTNEDNELSVIARGIFSKKSDSKLLLLSATPFKAMSKVDEEEAQTAHVDELRYLLNFLSKEDTCFLNQYENDREKLHSQIIGLRNPEQSPKSLTSTHKDNIESSLSSYICRTERAQIVEKAGSIVSFRKGSEQALECLAKFGNDEIIAFKELDQIAEELRKLNRKSHSSYLLEYQKSAPWTLSFMSGYQFKKHIDDSLKQSSSLSKSIKNSKMSWLSRDLLQSYKLNLTKLGTNARFKAVIDTFFDGNGEELLWVPPTNPYYPLEGSFKNQEDFSKSLLFSSWAMVPRALSGLISYEAERRLLEGRRGLTKEYYKDKKHVPKIIFDRKSNLIGWSYIYPSRTLASINPFGHSQSLRGLVKEINKQIRPLLSEFKQFTNGKKSNTYWYAAAPILLDMIHGYKVEVDEWQAEVESRLADGRNKTRLESLRHLFKLIESGNLGPIPNDLSTYLAELTISGPAICVLRSIGEQGSGWHTADISESALGFVSLFNKPESEKAVKKRYYKEGYWRAVILYCADGNLQAVIDEYFHLLIGSGQGYREALLQLNSVLNTNTVSVGCHFYEDIANKKNEGVLEEKSTLRCHYAVPLGNQKMTDEKGMIRVSHVRDAFNSPFRPFVLNSTSIGQEGLDFHWYCSRIVHWNLPSNPIDLEQREGRVNRYKSLVVRRRLVEMFGEEINPNYKYSWNKLFDYADQQTKRDRFSDLEPYWHLSEGSAQIERIVPMMPMSKDLIKLNESLKILSLYRLAFGQPRQEELIDNLLERNFTDDEIEMIKNKLVVNLSPLVHSKRAKAELAS
ncbi:DEAD/DEAH box helicase [Pseudoalteromonas phenolica]|uniref:DEAD/DEAH box helicase n=1 Tax=Pseudoalteromonas phenolica TaxID=161398 RepID=UPI00110A28EA|nr:helicase C-terminal domain-containing protein [Pseudoalteromonas phenolica]TMO53740.1 helicase [Pseudoalteromonas phenolica]